MFVYNTYLVTCHIICQEALCFFNLCMGMPIVLRSFCDLHVSYYLHSIRPTHTAYQSAFVVIQIKLNQVLCMFKILQWWSKPTGQNRQKISQQKYMHLSSEKVQILIQIIVELAGKCKYKLTLIQRTVFKNHISSMRHLNVSTKFHQTQQ